MDIVEDVRELRVIWSELLLGDFESSLEQWSCLLELALSLVQDGEITDRDSNFCVLMAKCGFQNCN